MKLLGKNIILTAPFDFPIHKTEDELQEEREKLVQEQSPIFNSNTNTADLQTGKFRPALHAFRNEDVYKRQHLSENVHFNILNLMVH